MSSVLLKGAWCEEMQPTYSQIEKMHYSYGSSILNNAYVGCLPNPDNVVSLTSRNQISFLIKDDVR